MGWQEKLFSQVELIVFGTIISKQIIIIYFTQIALADKENNLEIKS